MACSSLPASISLVLPESPPHPGPSATPAQHAAWSRTFADYCAAHAQFALELKLESRWRWLQAERIARFAAEIWAERVREAV